MNQLFGSIIKWIFNKQSFYIFYHLPGFLIAFRKSKVVANFVSDIIFINFNLKQKYYIWCLFFVSITCFFFAQPFFFSDFLSLFLLYEPFSYLFLFKTLSYLFKLLFVFTDYFLLFRSQYPFTYFLWFFFTKYYKCVRILWLKLQYFKKPLLLWERTFHSFFVSSASTATNIFSGIQKKSKLSLSKPYSNCILWNRKISMKFVKDLSLKPVTSLTN